jgi:VanZ family protein
MAVVMNFSGGAWSAEETGSLLGALFAWLLPTATPAQLAALHGLARKCGHLTEYAILALLWRDTLVRSGRPARMAAWAALAISIAWATLDEARQSTVPSRTGSGWDVVIDTIGAAAALIVASRDWRAAVDAATTVALWTTVIGGATALAVNALSGVGSVALWITTPAAALVLAWHGHSRRRSRGVRSGRVPQ